jgi:cobalt-zinc-cadmium efflux system membrane fusion protein
MKLVAVVLAVVMLAGCGRREAPSQVASADSTVAALPTGVITLPADSPKLSRIRSEAVALREFPIAELVAPGKVEVNPNRVARIVMPVPGRIRQVLVKLGDSVLEGQPLVRIDSPDAAAAVAARRQAQAQVRQTQASLRKSQADLERLRDLFEHRAAAHKDVLNAENDLAQTQSAVEQSQSALEAAQRRLELLGLKPDDLSQEVVVRSPTAGKVLEIAIAPGEYRNDTNASLMTVVDLRVVWIASDVPESLIRMVDLGESIQVELAAYPGQVLHARVTRIADTVDPQTRTVKVQAEISNPAGRLRPEMFGQIHHSHGMERLPALPATAVLQREGRSVVLVEEGRGRFREASVSLGQRAGPWLAATSGVRAGDRVVVDGAMLLRAN